MLNTFENRIAVITGAANGIGAALAHGFARQGMTVVVADLDEAGAQKTAASIGTAAIAKSVDVANSESVQALADFCFSELGQVLMAISEAIPVNHTQ